MQQLLNVLVLVSAASHFFFLVLETFLWRTSHGRKAFGMTEEEADRTWRLAANQGCYNGFLALGLVWSVIARDPGEALRLKAFFLGCVAIAAIVGAVTVSARILVIQGAPAFLGLAIIASGFILA